MSIQRACSPLNGFALICIGHVLFSFRFGLFGKNERSEKDIAKETIKMGLFQSKNSFEIETNEKDLTKIDIGDQNSIRNLFDDKIIDYLRDESKLTFYYGVENCKLWAMFFACVVAALSHWNNLPPPYHTYLIVFCIIVFFAINITLAILQYWFDGETIARICLNEKNEKTEQTTSTQTKYFYVKTCFPRYEDKYILCFTMNGRQHLAEEFKEKNQKESKNKDETKPKSKTNKPIGGGTFTKKELYVGDFFDKEGHFDEEGFLKQIKKSLTEFKKELMAQKNKKQI